MRAKTSLISVLFIGSLLLAGCGHLYRTDPQKQNTVAGTGGGVVGGLIASTTSSTLPASLITPIGAAFGFTVGYYYDQPKGIISTLNYQGIQAFALGDITYVYLSSDKIFEVNSSRIKQKAYPILSNVVKLAQRYDKASVIITGNTDDVPSTKEAKIIGLDQARSVAAYLWAMGVNDNRIYMKTNGREKPIATNHDLVGSSQNRHVLVKIDNLNSPTSDTADPVFKPMKGKLG